MLEYHCEKNYTPMLYLSVVASFSGRQSEKDVGRKKQGGNKKWL